MNNPTLSLLIALSMLFLLSCTKNDTEKPEQPGTKRLVRQLIQVSDSDTIQTGYFEYNQDNKLLRFLDRGYQKVGHGNQEFVFKRNSGNIVTSFKYVDSLFDENNEFYSLWVEDWSPVYDDIKGRYTSASKTYMVSNKYNNWEPDIRYVNRVDSVVYIYTGNTLTAVDTYVRNTSSLSDASYKLRTQASLLIDSKGRKSDYKKFMISSVGEPIREGDASFGYDDKMNPFNFGQDGVLLSHYYWVANFDSENNYSKMNDRLEKVIHDISYQYDDEGYPVSFETTYTHGNGSKFSSEGFYLYR